MQTWNRLFWICLTGTILLTAGVIFLPRYLSRSLDLRELNWVEVGERDDFSFLEPSSGSVLENVQVFRNLTYNGENLTLISSIEEPVRMNNELLEQVYNQVMSASEMGMLPWVGFKKYEYSDRLEESDLALYQYWPEYAKFARYYSLTYESEENPHKTEMLNFWYLRFSDTKTFDYYFIVHAVSYQIYYAELYNADTDIYAIQAKEDKVYKMKDLYNMQYDSAITADEDLFAIGCMQYYDAEGYDYIGSQNLYDKLGLVILYYEGRSVYIEQSVVENSLFSAYQGVSVGFQELANRVRYLVE